MRGQYHCDQMVSNSIILEPLLRPKRTDDESVFFIKTTCTKGEYSIYLKAVGQSAGRDIPSKAKVYQSSK